MRFWPKLLPLAALAFLLAACSPSTVITTNVDLLAFVSSEDLSGEQEVTDLENIELISESNAIDASAFGGDVIFEAVRDLSADASIELELSETDADEVTVELRLYVAPADGTLYAAENMRAEATAALGEGAPQVLDFNLATGTDDEFEELIQGGDFRIGMTLSIDFPDDVVPYAVVDYEVTAAQVGLSVRAGSLLGF